VVGKADAPTITSLDLDVNAIVKVGFTRTSDGAKHRPPDSP